MHHFSEFVDHHLLLCLAFVVVLTLTLLNEWWEQTRLGVSLSPQDVIKRMNDQQAVVIDLRPVEAFRQGHILNATNLPNQRPDLIEKFKQQSIILVCDTGAQSATLSGQLKKEGFSDVSRLKGGIQAWQQSNLPLHQSNKKSRR